MGRGAGEIETDCTGNVAPERQALGRRIHARLLAARAALEVDYRSSAPGIGHFVVDDLLPENVARRIHAAFPQPAAMVLRNSLRERKHVTAQMDAHAPLLEEIVFAFQEPAVVDLVAEICGIRELVPDEHLYAGGLSRMGPGSFLNPHLDNSHDEDRERWRVLNLLYYVTPDWEAASGGNLELWPEGPGGRPITVHSRFNRLAVMATHERSWHSVSPVRAAGSRCCVSNYYFSSAPLMPTERFHVTSFRGRPEQPVRDVVLRVDTTVRMGIRKVFKKGARKTFHVYGKARDSRRVSPPSS